MQTNSYDVTVSTFPQIIVEGSKEKPVLVVFWSPKSPICSALLPLLDKLQGEFNHEFTLARINCDVEQQIVSHFGVQSVPSIFIFKDGEGVDGFAGEQSEEFIQLFLKKHIPDPIMALLEQGQTLFAQGQLVEAKDVLLQAVKLAPEDYQIKLALAQVYLGLGEHENAQPILANVPPADQNMIYHSLVAELATAVESSQTPEISALENQLENADDKPAVQYKLALLYNQASRSREALALLYQVLSVDLGYENGNAKKAMLALLETIEDAGLVSEYRRKLYSLLY